ncbi:MAG TPA: hypothetical protein DCO90_09200, partial [Sphingobacterium sp.]|nr:hypothetical protein [Sphingobacterium sp.]
MSYLTFNNLQSKSYQSAIALNAKSGHYSTVGDKVFLSYRREDKIYVAPVVEFLKKNGVKLYIDY